MAAHAEYGALRVRTSRAVPEPKRCRSVVFRLPLSSRIIVGSSISTTVRVDEDGDMGEYLLPPPPGWLGLLVQ